MSITREDVLTASDVAALLDLKPAKYTVKEYAAPAGTTSPAGKPRPHVAASRPELEEAIRHLPRAVESGGNSSPRHDAVRHPL